MPILIQDYTWKQTEDRVFVTVPLKGVDSKNVDVFVSEKYVKLHYPPFLFELFLKHPIDDTKGKCCFTDSEAHLEFYKQECIEWDCLEEELSKCKKVELKIQAINEAHLKSVQRRENKCKLRTEQDRFAVSQAIEFDSARRNKIQQQRDYERDVAMKEFEDWRVSQENETEENTCDENNVSVVVNDSEITIENIVVDSSGCEICNYNYEPIEINIDEKGLWITNMSDEGNCDKPRELQDVIKESNLYETTSVDMLLDETGLHMENSINNPTSFYADTDRDMYVYETQGISREEQECIPDFGETDVSCDMNFLTISKDPHGGYVMENPIHKDSMIVVYPENCSYVCEVQGATDVNCPDEEESVCQETESVEIDGMTFVTDEESLTLGAEAEVGNAIDIDLYEKECTDPEPNLNSVTVHVDKALVSPLHQAIKGKHLESIDEIDEDQESFANLIEKYTNHHLDERYNNYVVEDKQYDTQYSEFFRTPQPPGTNQESPEYCEGNTDDFMPENYGNLSTPCVREILNQNDNLSAKDNKNMYHVEDVKEYVVDKQGDITEHFTNEEIYTNVKPPQTYQQLGVEITIDEKGYHTKEFNQIIDCSVEEATKFFNENEPFGETDNNCAVKQLFMECGNMESNEKQESGKSNIETLLIEQHHLLKEHIENTEKKFEELKQKLDMCCEKSKEKKRKLNMGCGDSSIKAADKKGCIKKEKNLKEKCSPNNACGANKKTPNRSASPKTPNRPASPKIPNRPASPKIPNRPASPKKTVNRSASPKKPQKKCLPPPRQTKTIDVSFTAREFPTPSRESCAKNEQEWLKKVTECRRATGFVSEDLRPEEQDPMWCKDKGDEFYKSGNHLGAISAYSHGIKMCDQIPALYSNRAACHLSVGNYNKCIEDCSSALDLLKPACPSNSDSRAKCIARRAVALTRVGMLGKGIDEMKAALNLQPDNCQLRNDLYCMERAWEQNPDSD